MSLSKWLSACVALLLYLGLSQAEQTPWAAGIGGVLALYRLAPLFWLAFERGWIGVLLGGGIFYVDALWTVHWLTNLSGPVPWLFAPLARTALIVVMLGVARAVWSRYAQQGGGWRQLPVLVIVSTLPALVEGTAERFWDATFWLPAACSALDVAWVRALLAGFGSEAFAWLVGVFSFSAAAFWIVGGRKRLVGIGAPLLVLVVMSFAGRQTGGVSSKATADDEGGGRYKVGVLQFYTMAASKSGGAAQRSYQEIDGIVAGMKDCDVIFFPEGAGSHSLRYAFNGLEDTAFMRWLDEELSPLAENIILGTHIKSEVNRGEFINVALHTTKDNGVTPFFVPKTRLIPLGEYLPPYVRLLGFDEVLSLRGSTFTPKEEVNLPAVQSFAVKTRKAGLIGVAPAICYDVAFRDAFVPKVRAGFVHVLAVLGDNHRFKEPRYVEQYFRHARLRAVELGLPMVVVMSAGASGYVEPNGREHRLIAGFNERPFEIRHTTFELEKRDTPLTLLSRHPDLSYTLAAVVLGLALLGLWLADRLSARSEEAGVGGREKMRG
jgi:apolipoprotein N-acyltransferase